MRFRVSNPSSTGRFVHTFRADWPVNYLLSVSTCVEHPNLVNPLKGELKRGWGANPF